MIMINIYKILVGYYEGLLKEDEKASLLFNILKNINVG